MNPRQKKFADEYIIGKNATEAAIKAGYSKKWAGTNADKLLKNTNVQKYIKKRDVELERPTIAKMVEVKEFWTTTMRNPNVEMKDRLKSSENLAKASGEFMEKVERSGNIGTTINIIPASKVKKDG